jgi:hypothetical protein
MFSEGAQIFMRDVIIEHLQILLAMENPIDKNRFTTAVEYTLIAGISKEEFAQKLKVSKPTVYRWRDGKSCPHPVGRKPAIQSMLDMLMEKKTANKKQA